DEGIHVFGWDDETGEPTPRISGLKGISNPSYLHPSPDGQRVYAVAEDDDSNAAANALSFDKTAGTLAFLNEQKTHGGAPCFINSHPGGTFAVTANYTGGNITMFPLTGTGELQAASQVIPFTGHGADPQRQQQPHLHCVRFSPCHNYLYATDLGTDQIHFFTINPHAAEGQYLTPGDPAAFPVEAGSGPRHLTFHPTRPYAYLINELSGTVTTFQYDDGRLTPRQYIQADNAHAGGSADIHITPDGKYLYASNRLREDGLAIFSIHPTTGELTRIGEQPTGLHPRNFIITPNGKHLLVACRDSHQIQIFRIDAGTGLLTDTGKQIRINNPVCLQFIKK
ncbi:MAG: lactonase family protein, partial [Tannerellaceae bacterium]|nr:lactonase family protein [Tannerellaceae bacterium]